MTAGNDSRRYRHKIIANVKMTTNISMTYSICVPTTYRDIITLGDLRTNIYSEP